MLWRVIRFMMYAALFIFLSPLLIAMFALGIALLAAVTVITYSWFIAALGLVLQKFGGTFL